MTNQLTDEELVKVSGGNDEGICSYYQDAMAGRYSSCPNKSVQYAWKCCNKCPANPDNQK